MGRDVSLEIAGEISGAKVFGSSENTRHGKYKVLITRIFADEIENDKGKQKMAFVEYTPLESKPSPQVEGDRIDYPNPNSTAPLKDDGNTPNVVGSRCAMKINFSGPGAMSAGANIKEFVAAFFNQHPNEITTEQTNDAWRDLSLRKDLAAGQPDPRDGKVFNTAKKANPACGVVMKLETIAKKKRTANAKGAYITKLVWGCFSPLGSGENALELVTKRRAEIEAQQVDDEEEEMTAAAQQQPMTPPQLPPQLPPQVAAPPPPMVTPPPPVTVFPPAGWQAHPTSPGWFWNPITNGVKNEAQLRAGA